MRYRNLLNNNIVCGLEAGADDYIIKLFGPD
jgi:DNA-binding response OmpR family regulator